MNHHEKFINSIDRLLDESLQGFAMAHKDIVQLQIPRGQSRKSDEEGLR